MIYIPANPNLPLRIFDVQAQINSFYFSWDMTRNDEMKIDAYFRVK